MSKPTNDQNFAVLAHAASDMGANYLIDSGVVYVISLWALGGEATRYVLHPGDYGYESAYRAATNNRRTLFREVTQ